MPEVLGPQTILSKALPTGVDAATVAQVMLRDGSDFGAFLNDLALAIGDFNQGFVEKWGGLFSITDEPYLEYPDGGAVTRMNALTDVSDPDAVHSTTAGHMLDIKPYGGALGGSWRFFRDARRAQLEAMIRTIMRQAEDRLEWELLNRLFVDTEYAVGTAGYNVGLVRTGGNVSYTPPKYAGRDFTSHTHFYGFDSDTAPIKTLADVLDSLADSVAEHGHEPPFTAIVARADFPTYRGLANYVDFVAPVIQMVDKGGATSGASFFATGQPAIANGVAGYYQAPAGLVEIRATGRVPTGYAAIYKSYGQNDPRNPLAVRVHPNQGFGAFIVSEAADNRQYPIQKVTIEMEFGVSVGVDRTNGAVGYLSTAGSWSNPTIG